MLGAVVREHLAGLLRAARAAGLPADGGRRLPVGHGQQRTRSGIRPDRGRDPGQEQKEDVVEADYEIVDENKKS